MVGVKLYVEGGGDSSYLHKACRKGFRKFLEAAGLQKGCKLSIVACGSRNNAYDRYCTAIKNGNKAILLVDSEGPVLTGVADLNCFDTWKPWAHLKLRDNWDRPSDADDNDCHLMVQAMETWILADPNALKNFYKQGFNENALPKRNDIENISKNDMKAHLEKATKATKKGAYSKGAHSFEILENINPQLVVEKSLWAKRFFEMLFMKMH